MKQDASTSATRLALVAAEGEGQKIEFKRDVGDLSTAMVAFANASGGSIFVGLDDHGQPAGLQVTNRLLSQIQDTAGNCDPPVKVELVRRGQGVIEVVVDEGPDKPYRCRGGFFLRNGPNSQKLKRNEIRDLVLRAGSFRFDEMPSRDCSFPGDFDSDKLRRFLDLAGIRVKSDAEAVLLNLDVAFRQNDRLVLSNAAALFFSKEPQVHIKESYCTAVLYGGTDRFSVVDRQDLYGDPISIIEETFQFVQRHTAVQTVIGNDARRREVYDYPPIAVREAITNAVAHRDYYYDGSHIYLHIFSDRLELENPGGLPGGLTPQDLGHRSVRRNRAIADLLYRAKYIERIGSGYARLRRALEENGNPPCEVSSTNFFVIRFLPRIKSREPTRLTERQARLHQALAERGIASKSEVARWLQVSEDTALRELKALIDRRLVRREGVGRATRYAIIE